jgi:diadenosine tetraphosphate (Ap4A) HIT family hydrolase
MCPFCEELDNVEQSEFRSLVPRSQLTDRIIAEDEKFVLIAGVGAISPGYLLLLPKGHVRCFSHLPQSDLSSAEIWDQNIRKNVSSAFGEPVVFEHGSTSSTANAGGCIDHAHIHYVPADIDAIGHLSSMMPSKQIKRPLLASGCL